MENNLALSVPCHGVAIIGRRGESVLPAFVVLYGLFYYRVILSRQWPGLADLEDFYIIHPQTRKEASSVLFRRVRPPRIPWEELEYPDSEEPEIKRKAFVFAMERLRDAVLQAQKGLA